MRSSFAALVSPQADAHPRMFAFTDNRKRNPLAAFDTLVDRRRATQRHRLGTLFLAAHGYDALGRPKANASRKGGR